VAREALVRQVVEGGRAQRMLDGEARRRALTDEQDDVIVVDYEQRPEHRPAWRHPRARFGL